MWRNHHSWEARPDLRIQRRDARCDVHAAQDESRALGKWCPRTWGNYRRAAEATGMTVLQNGDSEGCLGFDPGNSEQVRLALKIAGVRRKRELSLEQMLRLASFSFKRKTHA